MIPQLFNHLQYPWLLFLLPLPLGLLLFDVLRKRAAPTVLFSGLDIARGLPKSAKQRALSVLPFARFMALSLGIFALARPQFGTYERSITSLGVDIALIIDVSNSMQERDYRPSRLEAAKRAATNFVRQRESDRVSVIVFGTQSAVLCPPTTDMNAAETLISAIEGGIVNGEGTAVGDGLALGVSKLKDSKLKSRVAILLTDGESNTGKIQQPMQAAEAAKALNVRVYTIGLERNAAAYGGMLPPGSAIETTSLKQIAELTGGKYFKASDEDSLNDIYGQIDKLEKSEIDVQESADFQERFMYFWYPALALLLLEFLLRAFWLRRLP
ncbi:VWA domain-containing protein [soil metagenome]